MEIIDAHAHALPRGAMDGGQADARLETLLSAMRTHGIARACLMPINDTSWLPVREMNDFAVRAVQDHPELVGFIDLDLSQAHYTGGLAALEAEVVRFHRTTFIVAHLGGVPWFPLVPLLAHDNVCFDTSGVLPQLRAFYSPTQIQHVLQGVGYEHVLFGSDFPEGIVPQLAVLREVIPTEHLEAVLGGNTRRVGTKHGWWS